MSVKIIAEAGSNHNGSVEIAKKLVDVAKRSGADYVKFQIINPSSLYVPYYWDGDTKVENIVYSRRSKENLTFDQWKSIKYHCDAVGITFTASVFDKESVDFLADLGVPFIKLASSDLNNKTLIQYIAKSKIPLIISSGMSSISEINESLKAFCEFNEVSNFVLLHCVSVYPCALENTSLSKIKLLKEQLNCEVGFSDHTLNSKGACAAVALGVNYIEKHFTINKEMDGFDHKYASSPEEFNEYVEDIRNIEKSLNAPTTISEMEGVTKVRARRGLYLNKAMQAGQLITSNDIVALRPSNQLNPFQLESIIGMELGEDIREFEPLRVDSNKLYTDSSSDWKKANAYWVNEMSEKKMI